MSLTTLHIATKGFLAGTTLAIATSGFIQSEAVEVPVKPFGGSQQRYIEPRKVEIIHALDYEHYSSSVISFAASSKYEVEQNHNNSLEHNALRLITFDAASNIKTKNVRTTELKSESSLNFFAESVYENSLNEIIDKNYSSSGNLELSMKSNMASENKFNSSFTFSSNYAIRLAVNTKIKTSIKPDKNNDETEEILAVAIKYLYG